MQNEPSSSSRRRDAAQSRLQESPQSNDEEVSEAGVPHRSLFVRSRRQRDRGAESPGNGESGPELHSSGQPPALEYYRNEEECVSGEDTDADEMAEEEEEHYSGGEEGALADKSNAAEGLSDVSDSEEEEEEGELDNFLQLQESASKSKHAAPHDQASSGSSTKHRSQKQPHQEQSASSSSRYHQGRKRSRHTHQQEEEELDCSGEQYAAEVKRLRESKLKHNKNEQLRRKDMKEAVHRLRNQLQRKTKKPSTISVLKAAKQEIDELTAIKAEEEKELERLRQKELFLKYQLESLVSDHNKRLSSGGNAGVIVSPVGAGVVGRTPSFLHSSPTNPPPPPPLPPSLHSRPPGFPHAQFSGLFPTVLPPPPPAAAAVSRSTAAAGVATSPTAIRRVGLIDSPQHAAAVAAHANIITPTGLTRLPLPQPPSLIPFTAAATANLNPSTPPSIGGGSSTSPAARTPGAAISIFPTVPPGSTIIPGIAPLQFLPPRTTTAPATAQTLYTGFSPSFIMQYPGTGRHPLPTSPVVGAGLTATHPVVGRLPPMPPTFPFYLPTAALRPPTTALGVAGGFVGHYSAAATPTASQSSNTRHVQIVSAELPRPHTNGSSRRPLGGGDRNAQTTDDSESHHSRSIAGSKNGAVSAETYSPHTHTPSRVSSHTASVREVSADSTHVAGSTSDNSIYRVTATENRDSEGYRLRATKRQRSSDGNVDDDDSSYLNSRTTATVTEKRPKVFDRYSRNCGFEKNASKKHLLSAAPPLLKVIDLDTDCDTSAGERWSKDGQQFVRERDEDQYQHHCTLPPPPALRNAISTVIKHMQPRGQIVSSSMVTGVGCCYSDHEKDFERRNGLEDFRCRGGGGGGGGEQRYRMSNSLSSSDEGPDSPLSQQKFNGSEQSMCSYNKMLGRDGIYICKHSSLSDGVCSHKNSQYKNLRKKKNNFHRPNNYNHHTIVLQSTT